MRKNELRTRGEYQATIKNNFQFDYGTTILRLWSDYDRGAKNEPEKVQKK